MTLAMQSLTISVGMMRYHHHLAQQIAATRSLNGVYLMEFEQGETVEKTPEDRLATLERLPGVKQVSATRLLHAEYGGNNYTVVVYNDTLSQYFRPWDVRGEWLNTPNAAVISGYRTNRSLIDQSITLQPYHAQETTSAEPLKITGFLGKSAHVTLFSRSGTQLTLSGLTKPAYGHATNYIIISEDSEFYQTYQSAFQLYRNFLILFEDDISPQTKQELITSLESMGLVMDFEEIGKNTEDDMKTPAFTAKYLTLFSAMTLVLVFGISLSVVREKHRELAIYTICGCGKGKKLLLSSIGILLTTAVSFLLQCLVIHHFYDLQLYQHFEYVIIDSFSIFLAAGYALLVCLVCLASSYATNAKKQLVYYLQENRT